jgi:NitT/TauT family transport system ATP-binding protein
MRPSSNTVGQQATGVASSSQQGLNSQPRIRTVNIGMRYGDLQVFKDVNLAVGEREVLALVGPSGCGKTTLLRCLDGLIPVTEGEVFIEGTRVVEPKAGIAMVFQHFGLFPWKTVYQNVAYGLKLAGASKAEIKQKIPYFINLVSLEGFEHHYPYQISGGMQQRCGLARALAIEPRILMMDEPFAAVDAQTREILQFELLRIWEMRPTTMVFVTHSIEEAVLMGDRVVVLKGRPSSVYEIVEVDLPRPRNRKTLANPRFVELREHVWGTLMNEARKAEFQVEK